MHEFFSVLSRLNPGVVQDFSRIRGYFDNIGPAFVFNLSKRLSKVDKVGVLFPKSVLRSILPSLAKECRANFVVCGASVAGFKSVDSVADCDVVIGEPLGFSDHGFLVSHNESKLWDSSVVACVSLAQRSLFVPADCDLVLADRMVCEKGIVNFTNISLL